MIGVVTRYGHSVHGDDFKRLTLNLQVQIAIRGCVHDAPELALTRSELDLRLHRAVHREHLVRRVRLPTTYVRIEFNALLEIARLRVIRDGTATDYQDALAQAG